MNRRKAIGSMVVGAAATAATVRVAKAADTEIEILVDHWKKSKDLTLKTAEAMPAEFYDYKPFPEARAFGAEQQHLGQAEGFYLGTAGQGRGSRSSQGRHHQGRDGEISDGVHSTGRSAWWDS